MAANLCPWLGIEQDRQVRLAEPAEGHVCYAQAPPAELQVAHQALYCLSGQQWACIFYKEPPPSMHAPPPLRPEEVEDEVGPPPRRFTRWQVMLWVVALVVAAAVVYYYGSALLAPGPRGAVEASGFTPSPTSTPTPTQSPTVAQVSATPAPGPTRPTGTPTPYPGGAIYSLVPEAGAAGWVASDESRGNHLGDSFLYTGVYAGVIYHGVFQFDLAAVPRGATIHDGVLDLTGLDRRRLGEMGTWEVRVLAVEADEDWSRHTYQDVHNADVRWTLSPALGPGDLAEGQTNAFRLSREQLADLEQRLLDQHYVVSFRIDGPLAGENSLFAWDSGYSVATEGNPPRLLLNVGAPPKTPLPTGTPPFVVVTSTPTPANVLTAAARVETATAVAETTGQPTPTSIYEWTATPEHVVTSTPTPANQATAEYYGALMTAVARTTGTFTPTPEYLVTATPTPGLLPFEALTPTPPATPMPPLPSFLAGKILFLSDRAGRAGPWAMEADGSDVALLTAPWPYDVAAAGEAVSPDGTRVVYVGRVQDQPAIAVRPVGGGGARVVFVPERGQLSSPVWSPAREQIAFVWTGSGSAQVWLANADGSGLYQLTADAWGNAGNPSFSPDGGRIVYTGTAPSGQRQIWAVALDGTGRRNLSSNGYDEWAPIWAKP